MTPSCLRLTAPTNKIPDRVRDDTQKFVTQISEIRNKKYKIRNILRLKTYDAFLLTTYDFFL